MFNGAMGIARDAPIEEIEFSDDDDEEEETPAADTPSDEEP
jgi:hypothetical protein